MRLDYFLIEKRIFESRTKAKQAIERGEIFVNGKKIEKPAFLVSQADNVEYRREEQYVSLGGYKLNKALKDFNYDANGLTVVDLGCSTGGFTDCLLQNGAKKVYAVDLNDKLLHQKLKYDPKVVYLIKNVKDIKAEDFYEKIDLFTVDLSFISSTVIFETVSKILEKGKDVILLIKPQFENDKKTSFKNGIIKDEKIRYSACEKIVSKALEFGLYPHKFTVAPENKEKNTEYLILLRKDIQNNFNLKEYF